jgi:hypothetical protein
VIGFGRSYEEATAILLSTSPKLSEILDDPEEYDFGEDDTT